MITDCGATANDSDMRAIVVYYIGLLVHASDARCLFKSEDHGATYDLGPLNKEQEIKIGSGIGQLFEALQLQPLRRRRRRCRGRSRGAPRRRW